MATTSSDSGTWRFSLIRTLCNGHMHRNAALAGLATMVKRKMVSWVLDGPLLG